MSSGRLQPTDCTKSAAKHVWVSMVVHCFCGVMILLALRLASLFEVIRVLVLVLLLVLCTAVKWKIGLGRLSQQLLLMLLMLLLMRVVCVVALVRGLRVLGVLLAVVVVVASVEVRSSQRVVTLLATTLLLIFVFDSTGVPVLAA